MNVRYRAAANYATDRGQITALSLLLLIAASLVATSAAAEGSYGATAKYFPTGEIHKVERAPSKLAAANQALTACQSQHARGTGYCDIVEQSKQAVHSSAELKASIPSNRYPLYLWRLQNGESEVYLAGSIHLLKPGFYPLPRQYETAFANAEHLALEVDTKKVSPAQMQQQTLRYGALPSGTTLQQVLPPDLYQGLASSLIDYGAPIENFRSFKPSLVIQQLALFALVSVGYNPEMGLESHFRAKAQDKSILELESFDFQLELLFNADLETQRELTAETLDQMPEFEETTAQLVMAWLSGDDAAFAAITEAQQGASPRLRAYGRALIEDRNRSMANTITGYLNSPGRYFVLVGAAHLIGHEGVPAILAQRGYQPIRIYSDQSLPTSANPSNIDSKH